MIIFNWEINENELRLHEPVSGKQHAIKSEGKLDTDKKYDLEVQVRPDRIKVYANRRKRAEIKGNFSAAQGQIGLGPAFGSTLTVESFKGIQE